VRGQSEEQIIYLFIIIFVSTHKERRTARNKQKRGIFPTNNLDHGNAVRKKKKKKKLATAQRATKLV
jgi:hypothetical protein